MSVILGVFAHPDDEVICAGAVLSVFGWGGADTHCRFLTKGVGVRGTSATIRLDEMREASKVMKLSSVAVADFPDQELHTIAEPLLCGTVGEWMDALEPEIVFTHSPHDVNQDHRVVSGCVLVAARRRTKITAVYGGQGDFMLGSFDPRYRPAVDNALGIKMQAMQCYKSEVREAPDARSQTGMLHRAGYWAQWSRGKYAEAFELILAR